MNDKVLKKILILSVWENLWSLGKGCGVPDELHFSSGLTSDAIETFLLKPKPPGQTDDHDKIDITKYYYPNTVSPLEKLPGPIGRFIISFYFPYKVTHKLKSLAAMIKPDLILGLSHHSIKPVSVVGRELGIPSAVKLFGVMWLGRDEFSPLKYFYSNFDQIYSLRYPVDHYIVLNDGTLGKKALIARGIPEDKISFPQNGMNMNWPEIKIDRKEIRRSFGLPENDILVVTLSRFIKLKRTDHILKAAARLNRETLRKVSFVLAGDGSRMKHLVRKTKSLGLEQKVHFTGSISYDKVPELLKACDIFVGTSKLTNMAMPACEAMLCGLPVIAYDTAGTSEVVRDGETGLLVENSDIGALARKLSLLINDNILRKGIAEGAAVFGKKYFVDWKRRVKDEIAVLKEVVADYRS
ncbi:MAG TPA: glycosyltransferase family 4 protein [Candidatus Krumholzibacteriaceae bacterium]|nr:glycosyltransferase family 4 protein [Candidatus Krumholzibacteriaceae bacterium]